MDLITKVISHEGLVQSAYQDSLGYWTIGYGTLIDERKGGLLTVPECRFLLDNRLAIARKSLTPYDWFRALDQVRQDVLVELVFNMGLQGLLGFVRMIAALTAKDFNTAAKEYLNSKAAKQVGPIRSVDIAYRIKYGRYA